MNSPNHTTPFRMPKSASVPTFREHSSIPIPKSKSIQPSAKRDYASGERDPQPQRKFQRPSTLPHNQRSQHPRHTNQQQPLQTSTPYQQNIPLDYHLRQPSITDNPKKIPKFDYIRVIPSGTTYAIYLQNNSLIFCADKTSTPSAIIAHKTSSNRTLLLATMVRTGFFVVTDVLICQGTVLTTNEARLSALLSLFSTRALSTIVVTEESVADPAFRDPIFTPTHFFRKWSDFSKASLHIPYDIRHLEYCFYQENVLAQRNRFIYILSRKGLKKQPHSTELVHTGSREFRMDIAEMPVIMEDFKTCILENKPYVNVVGYRHLDNLEESDDDEDE
jgi:hypothetical protein